MKIVNFFAKTTHNNNNKETLQFENLSTFHYEANKRHLRINYSFGVTNIANKVETRTQTRML